MSQKTCPRCSCPVIIAIYDRDLDCTVAWKCEACGHEWNRDLAEVLTVADPAAFREPGSKSQ